MFVTSKLQPQAADPAQARMFTYAMPVFFTYMLLNTPAGLTLYMVTNNLLSILQTYGLRKWMANQTPTAAAT
jgi:YidC/Oxa1 family membrane protein insertase